MGAESCPDKSIIILFPVGEAWVALQRTLFVHLHLPMDVWGPCVLHRGWPGPLVVWLGLILESSYVGVGVGPQCSSPHL